MGNKRAVFFLGSMGRGGAERVISILSRDMAADGWKTDIGLLLFNNVKQQLDPSTNVHDLTKNGGSRILRVPFWLKEIRKIVKEQKPDVVVAFAARINILVLLACIGLKKKIIISERNDPMYDGRGKGIVLLTKLLYPSADRIVFQTNRVRNQFGEKIRSRGTVIVNPVEIAQSAKTADPNKIVTAGRMTKQKNQMLLLEAFADISGDYPNLELYIYGEGELQADFEAFVEKEMLNGRVHLMGNIPNLHEQMADALFFVLPSDYEGLSNALLEAMMMGLPCISTKCAGSDEHIKDGVSGLLTPVGDKEALKAAMIQYLNDSELRQRCSKGALEASESFKAQRVLGEWRALME